MPKVVAEKIGLRADLPSPGNGIAFLDRGPGVLRVMAVADPSVGSTKESTDALIDVAAPTKRLLFCLPRKVKRKLRLGASPIVAWVVPEREWAEETTRAYVYLVSSTWKAGVNLR